MSTPARPGKPLGRRQVSEEEERRRLKIHDSSKSDADAARRAGISAPAWHRWRKRRNLPTLGRLRAKISPAEERRRIRIIDSSDTLQEAASKIGVEPPSLYPLVRRMGRNPPAEKRTRRDAEWLALVRKGLSDAQIARKFGVHPNTVRNARVRARQRTS